MTLELRRDDWPAAKEFWSIVGFEEVDPPSGLVGTSAWVQRDDTQIHLQWQDDPVVPRSGHTAVVVDDWEGVIARLRAAGHEVEEHERYWGAARAFTHAPGGHLVELMAAPPP